MDQSANRYSTLVLGQHRYIVTYFQIRGYCILSIVPTTWFTLRLRFVRVTMHAFLDILYLVATVVLYILLRYKNQPKFYSLGNTVQVFYCTR